MKEIRTLREEMDKENWMECEDYHLKKPDVSYRSDPYANDVGNDPTAMHTVCDECDHQSAMNI